ncbi:hypothetical protein BKP35_08710 [Anaerobacillus arseniciselenatis]|uniref:Uncharacterized protein n=1 Tax=Anaerobacillus arseniciselenatis TaxID=85682 RepID=A0A1S2LQ85_9BACI|nr:hypothetical protein [Anaerobacillus arseniciselenatis]OIJ13847.1 hypothetical protein BKP35_08710 [Anaerobacillus arseniciselenatis]
MKTINLNQEEIDKLTWGELKQKIYVIPYKDLIIYFYKQKSKGENGLLVQKLLNDLSEEERLISDQIIEVFNKNMLDPKQWNKPSEEILEDVKGETISIENVSNEQLAIRCFLLLTLHYVFTAYLRKDFRKFIGLKKESFFKFFRRNSN